MNRLLCLATVLVLLTGGVFSSGCAAMKSYAAEAATEVAAEAAQKTAQRVLDDAGSQVAILEQRVAEAKARASAPDADMQDWIKYLLLTAGLGVATHVTAEGRKWLRDRTARTAVVEAAVAKAVAKES